MEANKPTLDYATPAARSPSSASRGVMLAIASLPIGGLSGFMLWIGIDGAVRCITHRSPAVDVPHDLIEFALFVIVGASCGFVCARWFREGWQMARRP